MSCSKCLRPLVDGVIILEARLKSGSEWFATLREYKTEKAYRMAKVVLDESPKFEYRIKEGKEADT